MVKINIKVAKIFGNEKFEPQKQNWPLLTFLLGANFCTVVTKKQKGWNEHGLRACGEMLLEGMFHTMIFPHEGWTFQKM
jgi:uncharacterized membrane protein YeiB